jgi:hypothetical protein
MEELADEPALLKADVQHVIDKELVKWPMSTVGDDDWLPKWIYDRFAKHELGFDWDKLTDGDRKYYEHEAAAVRRAVGRAKVGATGDPIPDVRVIDNEMASRHQTVCSLLDQYRQSTNPLVSVNQIFDIMCGRATPDQYDSALQALPTGVDK